MKISAEKTVRMGKQIANIIRLYRELYGYVESALHRGLRFERNFHGEYGIASDGGQGAALPGSYDIEAIIVPGVGTVFEANRGWLKDGPWVELADEIMGEMEEILTAEKSKRDSERAERDRLRKAEQERAQVERERAALDAFMAQQPK